MKGEGYLRNMSFEFNLVFFPSPTSSLPLPTLLPHRTLVNRGVLLVRDVGKACSWWFAIPAVSTFTRSYTKGE